MILVLARSSVVDALFEMWIVVEVALVVVALSESRELMVVDAVEIKPSRKASLVEVACSLVESLVKGQAIPPPQPVQVVTVRLPMLATFDRKLVVEARLETYKSVVVAAVPVAF